MFRSKIVKFILSCLQKSHDTNRDPGPNLPKTPATNGLDCGTGTPVRQQNTSSFPSTLHTVPHTPPHFPLELFPVFPPELACIDVGSAFVVRASEHADDG
jgi:hypothetical protein